MPYSQLHFRVVRLVGVGNLGPPRGAALWVEGESKVLGRFTSNIVVKTGTNWPYLYDWLPTKVGHFEGEAQGIKKSP